MKLTTYFWLIAFVSYGQTFEIKDRSRVLQMTVSDVKMSTHSDFFKEDIPVFQGVLTNVSGENLLGVAITGTVHKTDGSVVKFTLDSVCPVGPCDLAKDSVHEAIYPFAQPWPFTKATFQSVEFSLVSGKRLRTHDGFRISGFVAKDEDCLVDFLNAKSLTGLALRKKMVELVGYGCGFIVDTPLRALPLEKTKKTLGAGQKKVNVIQVFLLDDRLSLDGAKESPNAGQSGWVSSSTLAPAKILTAEDIGIKQ